MKKKTTTVTFKGNAEQEAQLLAAIADKKDQAGNLLPILQAAQGIYGYLPIEVQRIIARELDIAVEEVYSAASFYSQFKFNPDGEVAIAVCLGTACYVKGSGLIADKVTQLTGVAPGETSADGKYSFEATRCVGACGLAPVMTVNGDVYGRLNPSQVADVLKKYN